MSDANSEARAGVLDATDPPVYTVHNAQGRSPFALLADHAGQAVPAALGTLGIAREELDRHIG